MTLKIRRYGKVVDEMTPMDSTAILCLRSCYIEVCRRYHRFVDRQNKVRADKLVEAVAVFVQCRERERELLKQELMEPWWDWQAKHAAARQRLETVPRSALHEPSSRAGTIPTQSLQTRPDTVDEGGLPSVGCPAAPDKPLGELPRSLAA